MPTSDALGVPVVVIVAIVAAGWRLVELVDVTERSVYVAGIVAALLKAIVLAHAAAEDVVAAVDVENVEAAEESVVEQNVELAGQTVMKLGSEQIVS